MQDSPDTDVVAPMNTAIALPRETGDLKISAQVPPTTTIGHAAPMPHRNLNTTKDAMFGESALAIVQMAKNMNAQMLTTFLPYCSDMGPNTTGPITYPRRKRDVGRIETAFEVTPNSALKKGAPLDAKPLETVEFMTQTMDTQRTNAFLT
jgi:hypothetical protein